MENAILHGLENSLSKFFFFFTKFNIFPGMSFSNLQFVLTVVQVCFFRESVSSSNDFFFSRHSFS
jgi:hypothetical protein